MIVLEPTAIPDVQLVRTKRIEDGRGFFVETFNRKRFCEAGLDLDFVQTNHTLSVAAGTIRGLHFQSQPHAQGKLIYVVRGRIRDVAVDIRTGSPSFGRHVAVELSADSGAQLYVPVGFAHGFCTLEPNTEVIYQVTANYSAEHDRGMAFNDPALAIDWGNAGTPIVSDKDQRHPVLAQLPSYFTWST